MVLLLFVFIKSKHSLSANVVVLLTGAAYACAEQEVRQFIEKTHLPFLPTPMGKGVVSDDNKLCVAAARSRFDILPQKPSKSQDGY